jgi:phosphoglycolate phosphatase
MDQHTGVIFDLDGTLLDTLEDLKDSVNYVLSRHRFSQRSLDEVRSFVGRGVKVLMEKALPKESTPEIFDICYQEFREYYSAHLQVKTKPYDGILELLRQMKEQGVRMAVVSNKYQTAVEDLSRFYFQDLIPAAIGNREGLKPKPAPDSVILAADLLGLKLGKDRIFYVGDSEVDIMTAHNAKIPIISVTWGFRTKEELLAYHPEYLVESIGELREIIKTL